MISVREALQTVLDNAPPPEAAEVPSPKAAGLVLAEDVASPEDLPTFDRSAMDGFAVRHAATRGAGAASPRRLRISGALPAGRVGLAEVGADEAMEIMTGAPLPPGADAVVEQESTAREGDAVLVRREAREGDNVRRRGDEAAAGRVVLARGAFLSPAAVGLLAAVGRTSVRAFRPPRTAVLTTGNELVAPGEAVPPGCIRNSNAWMLEAALAAAGAPPSRALHCGDDAGRLRESLAALLTDAPHLLLITGGVSVGRWDFVRETLDGLGVRPLFWRVAQKPGKPLFAGRREGTLVLGLPGNPASALVCYYEYALPAIRKIQGWPGPAGLEEVRARLLAPVRHAPGLTVFLRGRLVRDGCGWTAEPDRDQGSHLLGPFARANALIVVDAGQGDLPAGADVVAHRLPPSGGGTP